MALTPREYSILRQKYLNQQREAANTAKSNSTSSAKNKTGGWVDDGTVKYNINGKTYSVKPASKGGYMDAYAAYQTDRTNQLNAYAQQLDSTLAQNNATTNANYDSSARQAYVDYMRKQKALPSQLQGLGVNGGATESALLNLYNNYGSSHAANEQQRNADLTANQQKRDDAYNQAYNEYLGDLNTQRQTAINNQINEYNNEITRFSSSVAQYPTTQKGYEKYQKWLKKLKNSKDPLKSVKMALVRQQMATQFPNGAPDSGGSSGGSGGGGSRRSYRRSGGGSSGGSNSGNTSNSGSGKSVAGPSPNAIQRTGSTSWLIRNIAKKAAKKAAKKTGR